MCASSAVKASRRRSFWREVSLWREARKRLRTWVEGVACACAVTGRVLLDAATHLTWNVASELDDMKGIEDAGGVLELIVDGVLAVPGRGPPSRSGYRSEGYRSESLRRARPASSYTRCQTCLGPQVHSSGPWDDPPLEWSTMPVSSRGPGGVGPGDATRISSPPSTRTPAKTGRVIRCGSQTRLDTGPHGIPRSYQLSSQASDGSSFEAQLSDLPADRPGPQTHPGGAHPLVMFQERWPGLVLWTGCFEGCWLLLVVLCPLARVLVG